MYCSFLYFCIRKQKKISLLHSDRIRAKYKDVVIQCCASGGRANWGTSYFFPAIAMASHISAVPNHTVFRTTSLKYRIDVAMSGRLGMEIQPKNMTDEEKTLCKKAISEYKEIRPPNEKMEAHYLLRCIYCDMKEAPKAMQCYQDALKSVDTSLLLL